MYQDTIAAVATPLGTGALGVVRLSGTESGAIVSGLFTGRLRDHRAVYGHLVDPATGSAVDEVMALLLNAPRSYTREEMVELTCHGGPLVVQTALGLLLRQGARLAEPGEFTLRAFLHGRLDLAQAESVLDIITSKTPGGLRLAVDGLAGGLSGRVRALRAMLIEHPEQFRQLGFIHLWRAQKQLEGGEQVHRAQCDFHGAVPIYAASDGVLFSPTGELPEELGAESLVIGYRITAPERDELRHPIQLPNHAHVRAIIS